MNCKLWIMNCKQITVHYSARIMNCKLWIVNCKQITVHYSARIMNSELWTLIQLFSASFPYNNGSPRFEYFNKCYVTKNSNLWGNNLTHWRWHHQDARISISSSVKDARVKAWNSTEWNLLSIRGDIVYKETTSVTTPCPNRVYNNSCSFAELVSCGVNETLLSSA